MISFSYTNSIVYDPNDPPKLTDQSLILYQDRFNIRVISYPNADTSDPGDAIHIYDFNENTPVTADTYVTLVETANDEYDITLSENFVDFINARLAAAGVNLVSITIDGNIPPEVRDMPFVANRIATDNLTNEFRKSDLQMQWLKERVGADSDGPVGVLTPTKLLTINEQHDLDVDALINAPITNLPDAGFYSDGAGNLAFYNSMGKTAEVLNQPFNKTLKAGSLFQIDFNGYFNIHLNDVQETQRSIDPNNPNTPTDLNQFNIGLRITIVLTKTDGTLETLVEGEWEQQVFASDITLFNFGTFDHRVIVQDDTKYTNIAIYLTANPAPSSTDPISDITNIGTFIITSATPPNVVLTEIPEDIDANVIADVAAIQQALSTERQAREDADDTKANLEADNLSDAQRDAWKARLEVPDQGGGGTGDVTTQELNAAIGAHNNDSNAHDDIRNEIDTKANLDADNLSDAQRDAWKTRLDVPAAVGQGLDLRASNLADDLTEDEKQEILNKLGAARSFEFIERDPRPLHNTTGTLDGKFFFSTNPMVSTITLGDGAVLTATDSKRNLQTPADFQTDIMAWQEDSENWYILYHAAITPPSRHQIRISNSNDGEEYVLDPTLEDDVTVTLTNGEEIAMERWHYNADDTWSERGSSDVTFSINAWSIDGHDINTEFLTAYDAPGNTLAFREVSMNNHRVVSLYFKDPDDRTTTPPTPGEWRWLYNLMGASGDLAHLEDVVALLERNKADTDGGNLSPADRPSWDSFLGLDRFLNTGLTNFPDPLALGRDSRGKVWDALKGQFLLAAYPELVNNGIPYIDRTPDPIRPDSGNIKFNTDIIPDIALLKDGKEDNFLYGIRSPHRVDVRMGRGNTVASNDTAVMSTDANLSFAGLVAVDHLSDNAITRNIRASQNNQDIPLFFTTHYSETDVVLYTYIILPGSISGGADGNNWVTSFSINELNDDGTINKTHRYERVGTPAATPNSTYNVGGATLDAWAVLYRKLNTGVDARSIPDTSKDFTVTDVVRGSNNTDAFTFEDTHIPAEAGRPGQIYRQRISETNDKIARDFEQIGTEARPDWNLLVDYTEGADIGALRGEIDTVNRRSLDNELAISGNRTDITNKISKNYDNQVTTPAGISEANKDIWFNNFFSTLTATQRSNLIRWIFGNATEQELVDFWHRLQKSAGSGLQSLRSNPNNNGLDSYEGLERAFTNLPDSITPEVEASFKTLFDISGHGGGSSSIIWGTADPRTAGIAETAASGGVNLLDTGSANRKIIAGVGTSPGDGYPTTAVLSSIDPVSPDYSLYDDNGDVVPSWIYVRASSGQISSFDIVFATGPTVTRPASLVFNGVVYTPGSTNSFTSVLGGVTYPAADMTWWYYTAATVAPFASSGTLKFSSTADGTGDYAPPPFGTSGGQLAAVENALYIRLSDSGRAIEIYRNYGSEASPDWRDISSNSLYTKIFNENPNHLIVNKRTGDPDPRSPVLVTETGGSGEGWAFINNDEIEGAGPLHRIPNPVNNISITRNGAEIDAGGFIKFGNEHWLYIRDAGYTPTPEHFPDRFRGYSNDGTHGLYRKGGTQVLDSTLLIDGTAQPAFYMVYHQTYGPDVTLDQVFRFEQIDSENPNSIIKVGTHLATQDEQVFNGDSKGFAGQLAKDTTHKRDYIGYIDADDSNFFKWRDITHISNFIDEDPNEQLIGAQPYKSMGSTPSYVFLGDAYDVTNLDNILWESTDGRVHNIVPGQRYRPTRRTKTQRADWFDLRYFTTYNYDHDNKRILVLVHYNNQDRDLPSVADNTFYDATLGITFTNINDQTGRAANFGVGGTDNNVGVLVYTHRDDSGRQVTVDSYEECLSLYQMDRRKKLYNPAEVLHAFFSPPENPFTKDNYEEGDILISEKEDGTFVERVLHEDKLVTVGRSNSVFGTADDKNITTTQRFRASGSTVTQGFAAGYITIPAPDFMIYPSITMGRQFILRGVTYTDDNPTQGQQEVPDDYMSNFNIIVEIAGMSIPLACALVFNRGAGGTAGILSASLLIAMVGGADTADHALYQLIENLQITRGNTTRTVPVSSRTFIANTIPGQSPYNISEDPDGVISDAIEISFDIDAAGNDISDLDLRGNTHDLIFNIGISDAEVSVAGHTASMHFDKSVGNELLERVTRDGEDWEFHHNEEDDIINVKTPTGWKRVFRREDPYIVENRSRTTTVIPHYSVDYIGDCRHSTSTLHFDFDELYTNGSPNYPAGTEFTFTRWGDAWIEPVTTSSTTGRWINKRNHGFITGTLLHANHTIDGVAFNTNLWVGEVEKNRFKVTDNINNIYSDNDNDFLDASTNSLLTTYTPQKGFMIIRNIPGYEDVHLESDGQTLRVKFEGGRRVKVEISSYPGRRYFSHASGSDALGHQADVVGNWLMKEGGLEFNVVSRITDRDTIRQVGDLRNHNFNIPFGFSLQEHFRDMFPDNHVAAASDTDRILMPVGTFTMQKPGSAETKYWGNLYMEYDKWDKIRFFDVQINDGYLDDAESDSDPFAQFPNHMQIHLRFTVPYDAVRKKGH